MWLTIHFFPTVSELSSLTFFLKININVNLFAMYFNNKKSIEIVVKNSVNPIRKNDKNYFMFKYLK